jgi:ribosome-binding protein aMBF1 (putative translation factor)
MHGEGKGQAEIAAALGVSRMSAVEGLEAGGLITTQNTNTKLERLAPISLTNTVS